MVRKFEIGEVIAKVIASQSVEEKIQLLRSADCPGLRAFLEIAFGDATLTGLEGVEDQYTPCEWGYGTTDVTLVSAIRLWRIFRDPNIKRDVVQRNWTRFLESLHKYEAALVVAARHGSLDIGMTPEQMREAIPGLKVNRGPVNPGAAPIVEPEPDISDRKVHDDIIASEMEALRAKYGDVLPVEDPFATSAPPNSADGVDPLAPGIGAHVQPIDDEGEKPAAQETVPVDGGEPVADAAVEEPKKRRKRRTKAEIEAAKRAAEGA